MPALAALVFDMNGVVSDDEPLHHKLFEHVLASRGIEFPWTLYQDRYLAYDDWEVFGRVLAESRGAPAPREEVDRLARRKAELYKQRIPEVRIFEGTVALMRKAAGEGLALAVCSGAIRQEVDAILARAGVTGLLAATVAAEDTEARKPSPEPYLLAVARLGQSLGLDLEPAACVAVEDSPAGIDSARAAGLRVLGVTHSYPAHRLERAHRVAADLGAVQVRELRDLVEP